jgi:cysteine sulfinate desulfinase/cysteine desulfurase-like protein
VRKLPLLIKQHEYLVAVGAVDNEFGQRQGVEEIECSGQFKLASTVI